MIMSKKIAITTGDPHGIGEEIARKALSELNIPKEQVVIVGKNLGLDYPSIGIDESSNGEFCFKALEVVCDLAKNKKIQGIVTAPVSKKALNDAGYNFNGQTEVLEHFLAHDEQRAEMLFIAKDLRLMLLTRHLPLSKVQISEEMIIEKTFRLNNFLKEKYKINSPKIALCALNPHAGEDGLLGAEELDVFIPAVETLNELDVRVSGPFPADGLFAGIGEKYLGSKQQEYDAVISSYHDQGLCAVKALAFDEVVNTTIGLDIIRTSPSCGTAYDIKGKGIARHQSMSEAIKLAFELA